MLSDARESTNRVKTGVIGLKEFFSEIVVVLVRKGSYDIEHSKKRYGKSGKIAEFGEDGTKFRRPR